MSRKRKTLAELTKGFSKDEMLKAFGEVEAEYQAMTREQRLKSHEEFMREWQRSCEEFNLRNLWRLTHE